MAQKVEGLNRLLKDLKSAGVEMNDMKDVFAQIAREGAVVAASLAPRRSGRLRTSIKGTKAKNYAGIIAGAGRRTPYAGPINYGWHVKSVKAEKAVLSNEDGRMVLRKREVAKVIGRNIKASHFMKRADVQMRPRVQQLLVEGVDRILEKKDLT